MIFNFIPLALTISTSLTVTSSPQVSFRVDIARINSRLKLPVLQTSQSTIKLEGFNTQAANPTPSPSFKSLVLQADGEFIMNVSLGAPPRQFPAIMDTGSDLVWTQCMPCMACYSQATPIFDPNASSSFSPLPCSNPLCASKTKKCTNNLCRYRTLYGDMSFTQGIWLWNNNGGSGLDTVAGIIGLGRGPLSLVSQLKMRAVMLVILRVQFSKNQYYHLDTMYVSLEGISVDDTLLLLMKSTFELKKDGIGGMILDTGTTLTWCKKHTSFPKLKFHFKDLVLELPKDNYLTDASSPRMVCLTIMPSKSVSLFGSQLQQNFVIPHDLEKQTVYFFPSQCAYRQMRIFLYS
uniref:Peptidase A1 domain-containing protein n=1 Tax=Chenopodium quinoa TaxID=63459 RepID=A0A803LV05_CHEQI